MNNKNNAPAPLAPVGAVVPAAQTAASDLPEITPMFLLNAAMCIESPHEVATSRKREVLASLHRVADALQVKRMADRALAGSVSAPDAPQGWKLVPVEPTEAMLLTAHAYDVFDGLRNLSTNAISLVAKAIYEDMLAAAPPAAGVDAPTEPTAWAHKRKDGSGFGGHLFSTKRGAEQFHEGNPARGKYAIVGMVECAPPAATKTNAPTQQGKKS